jgi:hypothetical protein
MIEAKLGEKLETILSELEKMAELVKQPSQKRPSNQRAFIESLISWIDVKSIFSRSDNHSLFQEIVQRTHSDFSLPVYNTLKLHIRRLAEIDRRLPKHQEKSDCTLMLEVAEQSADVFRRLLCLWKNTFDSWT